MRLGTAIERLIDNYRYASDKELIQDKVAWALYYTWKEADDHKTEPQTEDWQDWKDKMWAEAIVTEPQTDCNGCKFVGTYDTEFPCANCSRKTKDYYAKDNPQTERESE